MSVKIYSCTAMGLQGSLVEVEADILPGLSAFQIVGLGDAAVQEAKERIRSAVKNSGAQYPQQKKVINLAPAHLKKHGPHFDLPMAVGLLAASKQVGAGAFHETLIVGELALDGSVRAVIGILTMTLFARNNGWKKIIVPAENLQEASLVEGIEIIPVKNLTQFLTGKLEAQKSSTTPAQAPSSSSIDFADIKGQEQAKRALTITAAGGHHILLKGPPGVGKTMLARALPSILTPLTPEEQLEVLQIYSCAGHFSQSPNATRPFRSVHSTATTLSLIGGGAQIKPGEISLAHHGVLFLDELPEFSRAQLESLRQPLEEKQITLSRSSGAVTIPARFTLVASMNPCPCGYFSDSQKTCRCLPYQVIQYQKKISGPLLDRIDLHLELYRQPSHIYENSQQAVRTESSNQIRKLVAAARELQRKRKTLNADLHPKDLKKYCTLTKTANELLNQAAEGQHFSGRVYHQILKVARTIADLNAHEDIEITHLAEALQYRQGT